MPRRNRNRSRKSTKRNNRRRRFTRRAGAPRTRRTSATRTVGSFVVRGIRSLIGLIPGVSAISSIADFPFASILGGNRLLTDANSVYGLNCCLFPSLASCLLDSPALARNGTDLYSNYLDGQLIYLTITVEPTNIIQKRSGSWGLMFTPYRTGDDHKKYVEAKTMPTLNNLMAHQGVVTDRADRPLTLSFRPTPKDGYIGLQIPVTNPFGMICVAYQDEVRDSYVKFTAEEFSSRVRLNAVISLRSATVASQATTISGKLAYMGSFTKEFVTIVHGREQRTLVCDRIEDVGERIKLIGLTDSFMDVENSR